MIREMGMRQVLMNDIINLLIDYAQFNFKKKLKLRNYDDQDEKLAGIAIGVNILGEELESKVLELQKVNGELNKNNHFIEEITNAIPESILVCDIINKEVTYKNKWATEGAILPCLETFRKCDEKCEGCAIPELINANGNNDYRPINLNAIRILEEGGEKWYRATITPFEKDDFGNVLSRIITLTDISELKKKETELIRKEQKISRSLQEKQLLLQEIHHRVKNNLQIISGLIELQVNRMESQEAISQLKQTKNRIKSIALIHETLYQANDFSSIDMSAYTRVLVKSLAELFHTEERQVSLELKIEPEIAFPIDKAIPLGLLINEVVSNSYKHAFRDRKKGKIVVSFVKNKGGTKLTISDNGVGNPNIDKASATLGLKLINLFGKQLNTEVIMKNEKGFITEVAFPASRNK